MNNPELLRRAIERVADCRITEAMERGEFDALAGAGEPLADIDEPYDEMWWVRRWLRREQVDRGRASAELSELVRRKGEGTQISE